LLIPATAKLLSLGAVGSAANSLEFPTKLALAPHFIVPA